MFTHDITGSSRGFCRSPVQYSTVRSGPARGWQHGMCRHIGQEAACMALFCVKALHADLPDPEKNNHDHDHAHAHAGGKRNIADVEWVASREILYSEPSGLSSAGGPRIIKVKGYPNLTSDDSELCHHFLVHVAGDIKTDTEVCVSYSPDKQEYCKDYYEIIIHSSMLSRSAVFLLYTAI